MHRRLVLLVSLVCACSHASSSRAESVPYDDVLRAVEAAGKGLADGKRRTSVLASLETAIAANPKSDYLRAAKSLAADLKLSIAKEKALPRGAAEIR